jgi:transposase InsO family protein
MHSARPTTGPRSRYCMDFQGQGKASTGECEALAIIDDFTKTVSVISLPNRSAETLTPYLLDEIYFRRGSPDIIHSDAAKEFLSKLFTNVAAALHTQQTNTLGHNAQGNANLEQWWRYWNRCMRILSPAM